MITVRLPLYLSWKALKQLLGWPYGRSHTARLENEAKYHKGDPFPRRGRIDGGSRNSHPMWYTPHVLDWFKRHGLTVPENVEFAWSED
jgi:hypothetical protein